jgi:hypothetical protein
MARNATNGSDYPPLSDEANKLVDLFIAEEQEAQQFPQIVKRKERIRSDIIPHVRFRLAGWVDGKPVDLGEDLQRGVVDVEEHLIVDPERVRQELLELPGAMAKANDDLSKLPPDQFPFVRKGAHAYLSDVPTLRKVSERGFVWLAELGPNHIPIGYCHGLDSTPSADTLETVDADFPNLDAYNIVGPHRDYVRANAQRILAIWRTGIRESIPKEELDPSIPCSGPELSLRRLGLGSVLKFLAFRLGQHRERLGVILNVGHLVSPCATADELEMRNFASEQYNSNFLMDMGYRNFSTPIFTRDTKERIADMHWKALGSPKLKKAVERSVQDEGPLHRTGWRRVIDTLEKTAEEAHFQTKKTP